MSSILYYGLSSSSDLPFLRGRKVSESGPKIEDVRNALEELKTAFVGDEDVYIIIGPIDDMRSSASDALLKSLEDLNSKRYLVLWARDEFKVSETIQSRVQRKYIPSVFLESSEEAQELLRALENKDIAEINDLTQDPKILSDLILVLSRNPTYSYLWKALRENLKEVRIDQHDLFSLLVEISLQL